LSTRERTVAIYLVREEGRVQVAGGNPTCTCMYSRGASPSSKVPLYSNPRNHPLNHPLQVLYILFTCRSPSPSTGTGLEIAPHMDSGEGRGVKPVSSALEISSRLTLLPSDQSCPNLCALRSTAFPLGFPQAGLCSFEVNGTQGCLPLFSLSVPVDVSFCNTTGRATELRYN